MTQPPNQPNGWWQPPPQPHQPYPQYGSGQQPAAPPGQPGSTFGGTFQSQQYGGLGAFSTEPEPSRKRSKKPLLAGAVVVVLAAGGVAAWLLGAFDGDVLDQASLQTNVGKVLRDSYGEQDVKNVECPDGQKIETGNSFRCTVEIGSEQRSVSIRVLNDKPEYEVGAPK